MFKLPEPFAFCYHPFHVSMGVSQHRNTGIRPICIACLYVFRQDWQKNLRTVNPMIWISSDLLRIHCVDAAQVGFARDNILRYGVEVGVGHIGLSESITLDIDEVACWWAHEFWWFGRQLVFGIPPFCVLCGSRRDCEKD